MTDFFAHSPRGGVPAQSYAEHILNVRRDAVTYATLAARGFAGDRSEFIDTVDAGATFHDLGKLDPANQAVLSGGSRDPLPVRHEDAGSAGLLSWGRLEAAVLVAGHHAGLFSQKDEWVKLQQSGVKPFRDPSVAQLTDERLRQYIADHLAAGCPAGPPSIEPTPLKPDGFRRRLALSCLVDADHGDTARHYQREVRVEAPEPRWAERLAALAAYMERLPRTSPTRDELRDEVYRACANSDIGPAIRSCDAPVGSGKTTAVMAYLLRAAKEKNLRHIFVVLPYVNIIRQSVDIYREALTLRGDRPEEIVAEHHHQADFSELDLRQLTTLWRAPIIVTTAVQFFETLGSSHPARLRKLHEIPGSAVFIDETHAAIPAHLWPQVWRWLETWASDWGGRVVLASGSLPRFWELPAFVNPPKAANEVPDLVPSPLRADLAAVEGTRLNVARRDKAMSADELIELVVAQPGPRVIVLNTVQSAAVIADQMRLRGCDVLHLSTALAPIHRNAIVGRTKARLGSTSKDWTLVATSCIESGMNFSFRVGFRESASVASLIQLGGRVGRDDEYPDATVWDFRLLSDGLLADNPGLEVSRRVLSQLFQEGRIDLSNPGELAQVAMQRELTAGTAKRAEELRSAEDEMEYPRVADLCRVIEAESTTVVVDADIKAALEQRRKVDRRELQMKSVQIMSYKIKRRDLPVVELLASKRKEEALYWWYAEYDPDLLGYMAGLLGTLQAFAGGALIA